MYPGLDVNGDGFITRGDFLLAGSTFGPYGMAVGNQIFNRYDYNGDGFLNGYEAFYANIGLGGGYGFNRYGPYYY